MAEQIELPEISDKNTKKKKEHHESFLNPVLDDSDDDFVSYEQTSRKSSYKQV